MVFVAVMNNAAMSMRVKLLREHGLLVPAAVPLELEFCGQVVTLCLTY